MKNGPNSSPRLGRPTAHPRFLDASQVLQDHVVFALAWLELDKVDAVIGDKAVAVDDEGLGGAVHAEDTSGTPLCSFEEPDRSELVLAPWLVAVQEHSVDALVLETSGGPLGPPRRCWVALCRAPVVLDLKANNRLERFNREAYHVANAVRSAGAHAQSGSRPSPSPSPTCARREAPLVGLDRSPVST